MVLYNLVFLIIILVASLIPMLLSGKRFNMKRHIKITEEEKMKAQKIRQYYKELLDDPEFQEANKGTFSFINKYILLIPFFCLLCVMFLKLIITNKVVSLMVIMPLIVILTFLGIILYSKNHQKLNSIYNKKVIKKYLQDFYSDYFYEPKSGILNSEYEFKRYSSNYDSYYSEDLLTFSLSSNEIVKMSEVYTKRTDTDSEGHSTTVTTFHGLVGYVVLDLKNIKDEIYIGHSTIGSTPKVRMDSDLFEKYYCVRTTNEILAYKILTPDIMERLLLFDKGKYDFLLYNNKLYFRKISGEIFSACFDEEKVVNSLIRYSRELDENKKVLEEIVKYLKEKDS